MLEQIKLAQNLLAGQAHKTPVLTSRTLNKQLGAEVFFKCENFQRIGAFKFRGAYNCISQLSQVQKDKGIIAYLSDRGSQILEKKIGDEVEFSSAEGKAESYRVSAIKAYQLK